MNKNLQILNNIVNEFKEIPDIEAIALSGSSTAKSADNTSDFDLYIYSEKEIDTGIRKKIAEQYALYPEINNQYWETGDEWKVTETGKVIDIMYRSKQWIENEIERVWERKIASLGYTTCFVFNVCNSEIMFDKTGWYEKFREKTRTPYPEELSENIIKKNLPLLKDKSISSYFEQIEKAAERNDIVSINHRTTAFLASYFDILFAKNKLLHPGEKRLINFAKTNCQILPEYFENDITALIESPIIEKTQILENIVCRLKKII